MLSFLNHQRYNDLGPNIIMGQHNIVVVKNFIYLSSEETYDSAEIKRKIILAQKNQLFVVMAYSPLFFLAYWTINYTRGRIVENTP